MSDLTLKEFLQAKENLDKEIYSLIENFEVKYSCTVTAIDVGDFMQVGQPGDTHSELVRSSLPRASVEF